jgi:molybdate transport system permease protein
VTGLEPLATCRQRLRVTAAISSFLLPAPLWQALWLTVRLAFVTTVALVLIGIPLAQWLNSTRWRGSFLVESLVTLPVVLPPTVIGFYVLIVFSPQHPPGSWWAELVGTPLAFSFTGLVIASVFYSLPFAVQPFQAALRAVPHDLIDASRACGASPLRTFLRVHLPLARHGIAAGMTLGFAHTLGEFGVVLMIGGSIPGRTKVASIALYDEVQSLNYPQAHAFAAVLLVTSFALLIAVSLLQRRRSG